MPVDITNCSRQVNQALYLFCLGGVINTLAWSPILCRVSRSVVNFPDRTPTAVWIATLGIFGMFFLFVMAEASAFISRIKAINASLSTHTTNGPPANLSSRVCIILIASLSQRSWRILAFAAGAFLVVLITAVFLTIDSIRALFNAPASIERPRAEPWLLMAFILALACLISTISLLRHSQTIQGCLAPSSATPVGRCILTFLKYIGLPVVCVMLFVFWAMVAIPSAENANESTWKIISLGLCLLLLAIACINATITMRDRGPELSGSVTSETSLQSLIKSHFAGAMIHLLLVSITLYICLHMSGGDVDEYILARTGTLLVTSDWTERNSSASSNVLPLCAAGNPMPVFTMLCCCAWSTCSFVQHLMSFKTLKHQPDVDRMVNFTVVATMFVVFVATALIAGLFVTLLLLLASPSIWYILVAGVWETLPNLNPAVHTTPTIVASFSIDENAKLLERDESTGANHEDPGRAASIINNESSLCILKRLQRSRTYRWIEYSVSATSMFVVVLVSGDVRTAHELVLSASLFCVSMLLINPATMALDDAERSAGVEVSIKDVVKREMPFIFLSIFAKSLLCTVLTVPVWFGVKSSWAVQLRACGV